MQLLKTLVMEAEQLLETLAMGAVNEHQLPQQVSEAQRNAAGAVEDAARHRALAVGPWPPKQPVAKPNTPSVHQSGHQGSL